MVGVMRGAVAAFALAVLAACATAQPQAAGLSGVWVAKERGARDEVGGYFRADLTQDHEGRVRGYGVVDPCPRCAGFMEYELTWEGGFEGDALVLTGTPEQIRGRHTVVRFEGRADGEGFAGVLSGLSGDRTMDMVMERLPAGE